MLSSALPLAHNLKLELTTRSNLDHGNDQSVSRDRRKLGPRVGDSSAAGPVPETKRVLMACRSEAKANTAINTLAADGVDKNKLQYIHFDASASWENISMGIAKIQASQPLDGVVLNAGGIGHDKSGLPVGPNNVLDVHQINLIGHIQLLDLLVEKGRLAQHCRVVFSGSEGARGVAVMGIAIPKMGNTNAWYDNQLKGNFKGFDPMKVYPATKGMGALYFAAWARRHPKKHVLTVSPGGTSGTGALKAGAVPNKFRVILPVMMPLIKRVGMMHSVKKGAARYVEAVTGTGRMARFTSGTFVASQSGMTGEVSDQTVTRAGKQYGDKTKQELAYSCLSAYTRLGAPLEDITEAAA